MYWSILELAEYLDKNTPKIFSEELIVLALFNSSTKSPYPVTLSISDVNGMIQ